MERYTKKDSEGRYYIESANGKLESNIKGHTYGEAIEQFAYFENAAAELKTEVAREIFEEIKTCLEYEYMSYLKAYDYTLLTRIEELEKKYTEDQNNENQNQT